LETTIELKLAVVVPAAINARLSSASCKPQVITKKPTNTKIATKTQVSKGIPTYFLVVCAYKLSHKKPILQLLNNSSAKLNDRYGKEKTLLFLILSMINL
jgi:hypothetical protein